MSNVIIVDGVNAPSPTVFEPTYNPQQKSAERNANGKIVRETLPDKWSINLEWEFSSPDDFYAWFNKLKSLTRINFNVTFPAPTGADITAEFYISPISARLMHFGVGATGWWKTMKCSFIEV